MNWFVCILTTDKGTHLNATPIVALLGVPEGQNENSIIQHLRDNSMSALFDEQDSNPWANHCVISEDEWNGTRYIGCSRIQPKEIIPVVIWVE